MTFELSSENQNLGKLVSAHHCEVVNFPSLKASYEIIMILMNMIFLLLCHETCQHLEDLYT